MDKKRGFQSKISNPNFQKQMDNRPMQPLGNNQTSHNNPFGNRSHNNEGGNGNGNTSINVNKTIMIKLKQARSSGMIDISNLKLVDLPPEVFDPNVNIPDLNWWEMVDITKLEASNNLFTEDVFNSNPQCDFSNLAYLIFLRMANNKFTAIPETMYSLSSLKLLDLSSNSISYINPTRIKCLSSLISLDLSKNQIREIPNEIKNLTFMEALNLSSNLLAQIPEGIGSMFRLKKLYLDTNQIESVSPYLFNNLINLEEIQLFKNRISSIPYGAFDNMKNLVFIDLHSNYLQTFGFNNIMERLDSILLSYNQIVTLEHMDNCPNLNTLDLNNNKIVNFPMEIISLKNLTTLNLMNNSINDFPPTVGLMEKLVRINIEGNPLKRLVSKMKSANTEQLKQYLKTRLTDKDFEGTSMKKEELYDVNIANKTESITSFIMNNSLIMKGENMLEIPVENIQKYIRKNSLEKIDFSNNKLESIYPFTYLMEIIGSITEINLSNNKINGFPIALLYLPNLRIINISKNNLKQFPEELNQTNSLPNNNSSISYLDLSFNFLYEIPLVIAKFDKLATLMLNNNQLKSIDIISSMRFECIDTLSVSYNQLDRIPNKLYRNIPSVKCLLLDNNNMNNVPTDLGLLFMLNNINFYGNPIKKIRSNVLSNASSFIAHCKKTHLYDQEDTIYEENYNQSVKQPKYSMPINKNSDDVEMINNNTHNTSNSNTINNISYNNNNYNNNCINSGMNPIDKVNEDIMAIESELKQPNLAMWRKNDLRKQLHSLMRDRAKLLK